MWKSFTTVGFLTLLCIWASAQKANFEFYTSADGLSGNYTANIAQDQQGFIWVVNDYKLHRFDGRKFIRYPLAANQPLVSSKRLNDIQIYQDSLFLITSQNEVFIMNPRTNTWRTYPYPKEVTTKYKFLWMGKRGEDQLFCSFTNNSNFDVWRFRNGRFEPTKMLNILFRIEVSICFDKAGNLYTGLGNRLYQTSAMTGKTHEIAQLNDCPDCNIEQMCFQPNGFYFIVKTPEGNKIYFFNVDNKRVKPHPVNRFLKNTQQMNLNAIRTDGDNLWICGADRNLVYYNKIRDTLYNFRSELLKINPNSNALIFVIPDNTGSYWIPTRLGLIKATLQLSAFDHYFARVEAACNGYCSFRGITEDAQGNIYASFYRGIAKFDPNTKKEIAAFTPDAYPSPWGLHDSGKGIWVNNGQLLDSKTNTLKAVKGSSDSDKEAGLFSMDRAGKLWRVYGHELFYLDTVENTLRWEKELELPQQEISLTEAIHAGRHSGQLWISHNARLLRYSPKNNNRKWFDFKNWRLPISRILAIEEVAGAAVWMATDIGLVYFNPSTGQTLNYTKKDGISNDFVCGMLMEGDSCLWLSTNNGLSRFHIASKSFVNFFENDGLTQNEFNRLSYYKARNGRMFFGGLQGINAFFPKELMAENRHRNEAAQVVLSSFEYVDERQDTTFTHYHFAKQSKVELNYWHRSFTFEYVLTDFRKPSEIYYSYQMEGYENVWSTPSSSNFTRFSSLPAGKYTFRVKARDGYGLWHSHQLAVEVVVYPPWWKTGWAYLVYFLLLLALGYLVLSFFKRRLLLQNELDLKAKEAKQLKELDAFKSRLYTNLTHEFRTPLTVILGMVQQIRNEPKKHLEVGTRLIENNGKNVLRLINQLLDLSKLEDETFQLQLQQGDIIPYLRYITESFHTYANSKNLSLRFFTNLESLVMDYDPLQVQHMMTNLISNALKFTPSDGDILVKLAGNDQELIIEVRDTGIGIAEKDLPHVFDRFYQVDNSSTRQGEGTGVGLAHTQELTKLMGGKIAVESELGKGTRFLISLPVHRETDPLTVEHQPVATLQVPDLRSDQADEDFTTSALPLLLIIEDNQDVVIYLKSCLEGLYNLQVAYNGKIGIEKALEQIPDLIISDVMMPEKDGYEVCDTLKNDERTSHIPIILLTAKVDAPSRITGLKRGADAYLTKPFDQEELLVRLEMLIKRQKRMVARFSTEFIEKHAEDENEEATQIESIFLKKVQQIVAENYQDEDFSLPQLCHKIGMSRSQLFRKMQALIATSPSTFIRDYRLNRAKELLQTTDFNVSEITFQVGFKNVAHFSKSFQDHFGYPPSATNK